MKKSLLSILVEGRLFLCWSRQRGCGSSEREMQIATKYRADEKKDRILISASWYIGSFLYSNEYLIIIIDEIERKGIHYN
ncbi:hypothetical protein [Halobacillus faecis]